MVWPAAIAVMAAVVALVLVVATGGGGSTGSIESASYQQGVTAEQQKAAQEFLARQQGRITILNQQSYPSVDGHWIVRFTTKGTHDLIITAVDGTTFGVEAPSDIEFVELSAGNGDSVITTPPLTEGDTITFPNYSSETEGYLKLLIHTPGSHHLRFQFGSDVSYAQNTASVGLEQKISDQAGGFTADILDNDDQFGFSVAGIGDINNDGIEDIAVGAPLDDDGGDRTGAVYILFMDADGTVDDTTGFQKISDTAGGITPNTLDNFDQFGFSVAGIGDIDNDGIPDLAVGAPFDDDEDANSGAVYILFMDADGTVDDIKGFQKISDTAGGFTAILDQSDQFGGSIARIGDIDNDGIEDIAVGAQFDDDGDNARGAVYILFMDADGTVDDTTGFQKISDQAGGFTADTLDNDDRFGRSVAGIGDINNDGIPDIAVGAINDDDGGTSRGAIYILFMDADGTVDDTTGFQKISDTAGGFTATLDTFDFFGGSIAGIGDINNDGIEDLAVGAVGDDDGGTSTGAVYILFMDADGTVDDTTGFQKISSTAGGFTATLDIGDLFGRSVARIGDINNDGIEDIAVGAYLDDDGGTNRGAVYILGLNFSPTINSQGTVSSDQKISDTAGGFTATLDQSDQFGISVAGIGDINNDGIEDIAVGAYLDDDGGADRGAVYILFMDADGTVDDTTGFQKISHGTGGVPTTALDNSDFFGWSVAGIGDIDNDGTPDIAVGSLFDDDGGVNRGAVYIMFLNQSQGGNYILERWQRHGRCKHQCVGSGL